MDATSSFTILEAIIQHITGVGFQDQLIWSMHSHKWKTMYHYMACQWPKNIACRQRSSGEYTQATCDKIRTG